MSLSKEQKPDPWSIQRGNYAWSPTSAFFFTLGRLLTLPVQYMILTKSTTLPLSAFSNPAATLSSLTFSQTLLLAMPAYAVLKHIYWAWFLMREPLTSHFVTFATFGDMGFEALTSYVSTIAPSIPYWSPSLLVPGAVLNFVGITTELLSETQRAAWKKDKRNEGKVYTGSLWGYVRNPSYTCNVIFSFGYALAAGGPLYAMFYSGIYVCNFFFNAVPGLEAYMRGKYGKQWEAVEKKVRWRLFPGIY
ncbi:hypothetical protein TWF694_008457 [Orbilia ellipsospora]|uniref:Steroid 5-alpha reductase C-terminal domain-containing protein n=1 Tax=Orbilia ellipsospora TaxID=2528407 RepID=A0AAV9XGK6_9PEZI